MRRSRRSAGPRRFDFPDFERDYEFVALRAPGRVPVQRGPPRLEPRAATSPPQDYRRALRRGARARTPTRCTRGCGRAAPIWPGPLARYSLNFDRLSPLAQEAARDAGLAPLCRNPFQSIIVRGVEVRLRLRRGAADHRRVRASPSAPPWRSPPRAGIGHGCTEAPRGILYHRYALDADGPHPRTPTIVPPTSQNQKTIEEDLRIFVGSSLALPDDRAALALRAVDPQLRSLHLLRDALPRSRCRARLMLRLIIGIGNPYRADDCAGHEVVRLLEGRAHVRLLRHSGEPTALLPYLEAASAAWLIDAALSGAMAGTIRRYDAGAGALPSVLAEISSHGLGLVQTIELARTLGTLPRRCVVFAIEGERFDAGAPLSPEVARAAKEVARRILRELAAAA